MASGRTDVLLAKGDDVVCTYKNSFRRPPSGLTLRKISAGGTAHLRLQDRGRGLADRRRIRRRHQPNLSGVLVTPTDKIADLSPGTYTVTETTPGDDGGTWSLDSVSCTPNSAKEEREGGKVRIIVVENGTVCAFNNRFTPAGRITLRKITLGGTGTTRFQVRPEFGDVRPEREQVATTTEEGVAVTATGEDLDELPVGRYSIIETIGGPNRWETAYVACNDRPIPSVTGQFTIALTNAEPALDCTVANKRIDVIPPEPPTRPEPPTPPGPPVEVGPEGGVAGEGAQAPVAELRVTKRVLPRRVRIGGVVRYLITVTNRGPDPAEEVTLSEPGVTPRGGYLELRPSKGTCRRRPPRHCDFGTLRPGERVTLRVRVKTARTGRFVNRVAVNSSTQQQTERGKRARAAIIVRPLAPPSFTG